MGFFSNLWRSVSKPDRVRIAPSPDPPDPMEGIVETLWPFSKDEEILRERIAQLANSEVPSVAWELYALRLNLLRALLHAEMLDGPAFSTLLDRVNDEARRRLRDVGWPANYSAWIENRERGYASCEANRVGPPDDSAAAGYGAQFAAGFNSDNVALVNIGGEEAKRALNRLADLVEDFGGAAWGQKTMSEFLAEVLPRIAPTRGQPTLQRDEERQWRRELDRRLLEFGATHSFEELHLAVGHWAGKLASVDEIAAVIVRFSDTDWVSSQVQMLEEGDPSEGAGFAYFPDALEEAGVILRRK